MKPSETLWAAKDLIEKDGWCKNTLESPDGRICALGAIGKAITGQASRYVGWDDNQLANYHETVTVLGNAIPEVNYMQVITERREDGTAVWENRPNIPDWNDHHHRIKEDVLSTFEKAAIMAEEAGR